MKAMHGSYAIGWAVWTLGLVLLLVIRPESIWWVYAHLGAFFVLEGIAVAIRTTPGDTLSEFMQAVSDKASDRARWYQGFNALTVLLALLVSAEGGFVVAFRWGWVPLGLTVTLLLFCWLLVHWQEPEKYDAPGDA